MNFLFIMTDQMRADCMSCAGHPIIQTPNLDKLAQRGVRFTQAYVQSAVCGPARMSFYTGRYVHAHRSTWNGVPLPEEERTIGHYFNAAGYRAALAGKTHYVADHVRISQLQQAGFDPEKDLLPCSGFEPFERDDGMGDGPHRPHNIYLRSRGYDSDKPYSDYAIKVKTPDGKLISGWDFDSAPYPTLVKEEDSDTAHLTRRAMDFIREATDRPWFLHLSYLKPHWPNVAPAPYHALYDPADVPAPNRNPAELENAHPIHIPFRTERRAIPFDQERIWRTMRATYYGLITQIDDHLGKLFQFMEERGLMENTFIIFTSDHGEYMGDHWMFEKELFYDEAYRVPWIVYDPSSDADATRGSVCDAFVQCIDAVPTFLDAAGLEIPPAVQGRSLMPFLHGDTPSEWQDTVYADWDFRFYQMCGELGLPPHKCRAWMIRDARFKYWHFIGLPPVLFDLTEDPHELVNRGDDPKYRSVVDEYRQRLLEWRMETEDQSRAGELFQRYGTRGVVVPTPKWYTEKNRS